MTGVAHRPKRGTLVEVRIAGLDASGAGIGELEGARVRVRGALPGARVRVLIQRRRRGAFDARLVETLAPSPEAVAPRCRHLAACGGCSVQDLAYPAQLVALAANLEATLAPLLAAAPAVPPIAPILPARELFGYRNKMDFTFGARRFVEAHEPPGLAEGERGFALGLHARGLYQKVIDVQECAIAFEGASAIVATVRELTRAAGLLPWDPERHTGLLRHLVLRRSAASGEVLWNLVTSAEAPLDVRPLADLVLARHPEIATAVQTVSTRLALVASGEREILLHGRGYLEEELAGLFFRVSAGSFFQTNSAQAQALARVVTERAGSAACVFDLCCGGGALGLVAARRARRLVGFEIVPEAVADARANAERNRITHAEFVEGDVAETLARGGHGTPDLVIADPPRAGLHPRVVSELQKLAPARVVYVSCNPSSAVRDLLPLLGSGYALVAIEPLDLFPHTPHLECVFTLEREAHAGK
jgi:23S rRNA (uracil1939-C5)-methyltransferase